MRYPDRMSMVVAWACLLGVMGSRAQVCLGQPARPGGGIRAPIEPVKDRAAKADKVFVGTLVNKVEGGGWARAQLRVDEPIKGVKKGDVVKVQWLPKVAGYDAPEGQTGLALLSPKEGDSYWLRADTFDDVKLADEARKAIGAAPGSQRDELEGITFGQPVNGVRLGLKVTNDLVQGRVTGLVVLQNVSDKPVLVLSLLVHGATVFFKVTGPDGAELPYRGPVLDWDVPDYEKAVKELKPKEFISADLPIIGFTWAKEGKHSLTATYNWQNARPPQGRQPVEWKREPIWTGTLSSGQVTMMLGQQQREQPPAAGTLKESAVTIRKVTEGVPFATAADDAAPPPRNALYRVLLKDVPLKEATDALAKEMDVKIYLPEGDIRNVGVSLDEEQIGLMAALTKVTAGKFWGSRYTWGDTKHAKGTITSITYVLKDGKGN